jgi:hypothetical protein
MDSRRFLLPTAFALAAAGCTAPEVDVPDPPSITPVYSPQSANSRPSVRFHGGSVMGSVKIVPVYWGLVPHAPALTNFYTTIASSEDVTWLSEYAANGKTPSIGSVEAEYEDNDAIGSSVDDSQVVSELNRLLDSGRLPPADSDTVYMVHLPPGVTSTVRSQGWTSCNQKHPNGNFCAYHGRIARSNGLTSYAVLPYPDCGGCGFFPNVTEQPGNNPVDAMTKYSSHELAEAMTNLNHGWYADNGEEIGDICQDNPYYLTNSSDVDGYIVQKSWSNRYGKCISQVPSACVSSRLEQANGVELKSCDGDCVDVQSDPKNCGTCGTHCFSGSYLDGCCNGGCVDFASDSSNCGGCGISCGGNACIGGRCSRLR